MGETIDYYTARVDEADVRAAVPDVTEYETPIYMGGPMFLSMFSRYMLVTCVLLIHLLFWWGESFDGPNGEGGFASFMGFLHGMADLFGIVGFFILVMALTWLNHFLNFATSGRWYTISLLLISVTPGLFFIEHQFTEGLLAGLINLFGTAPDGFLPEWQGSFYLIFGLIYTGVMFVLTVLYQRAFIYVVTDKNVYIKKEFLKILDTSGDTIQLGSIENLKVERNLVARLLGYGSLHVITASGMGLREESVSIGAASVADIGEAASDEKRNMVIRILRVLVFLIRLQRTRTVVDTDPEDCFYGIRKPERVQKLINELRTMPRAESDDEPAAETSQAEGASSDETLSDLLD